MALWPHFYTTLQRGRLECPASKLEQIFLPEPILTIQVSFCRGGAGLQYEVGMKSYCQSIPEIHAVTIEQILYVL